MLKKPLIASVLAVSLLAAVDDAPLPTYTAMERRHWAFQPRKNAAPPTFTDAAAKAWIKTPIDAFILACLRKAELKPASQADRVTLIRRATYDLHGLPPTPDEIDAFLNDKSADAWAKVIDRLL